MTLAFAGPDSCIVTPPTLFNNFTLTLTYCDYRPLIPLFPLDEKSSRVPDAFLFRQIHRFPLLVVNKAQAVSTDTIHRVRFNDGINGDLLAWTLDNVNCPTAKLLGRIFLNSVVHNLGGAARKGTDMTTLRCCLMARLSRETKV